MAHISKMAAVMLALVSASVLMSTAVEANYNPYGLYTLRDTLNSFNTRIDTNANNIATNTAGITALKDRVSKLEALVASFYDAANKAITATDYKLTNSPWVLHMEGNVFVIRQLDANHDYRYAFYPNKYTDV